MSYCPNCGTQAGANFCPKCGTPVGGNIPPTAGVTSQPEISINGASALCYLLGFVTGVIFLVLPPYHQDRRVRFNAFQSIFLSVLVIALHVGISMLAITMNVVSFSLGLMISSLHLLVSLAFFLIWLYVMWKSYQGERVVLPLIGPLAERQATGPNTTTPTNNMGKAA